MFQELAHPHQITALEVAQSGKRVPEASRFKSMTREEHIRFGVERGVRNAHGTPKPIEGDPCVTRV